MHLLKMLLFDGFPLFPLALLHLGWCVRVYPAWVARVEHEPCGPYLDFQGGNDVALGVQLE